MQVRLPPSLVTIMDLIADGNKEIVIKAADMCCLLFCRPFPQTLTGDLH